MTSANNYAVSGTWHPHKHPTPTVIAGILSAAIYRKPSNPIRLFVTDGSALKIDSIRETIKFLLPETDINTWATYAKLYCLASDFFVPISLELPNPLTVPPQCRELRFDAPEDVGAILQTLHNEFERLAAADLPRAAVPDDSHYTIQVVGRQMDLCYNDITKTFYMQAATQMTFRLSLDGNAVAGAALNSRQYQLEAVESTTTAYAVPFAVEFEFWRHYKTEVSFKMQKVNDKTILCYGAGGTTLEFEDPSTNPGLVPVLLAFVRKRAAFSPQHSVVSSPVHPIMPASPATVLSLDVGDASSSPKTFGDLVKDAVDDVWADYLLSSVPSAPFLLSGIAGFEATPIKQVDSSIVTVAWDLHPPQPQTIIFPDVGLGPMVVRSLRATLSLADLTLKVDAEMDTDSPIVTTFQFGLFSEKSYLEALGYKKPADPISLAALGTTIVGNVVMLTFLSCLPLCLTSFASQHTLASWLVNARDSHIAHCSSPLGTDVRLAKIVLDVPPNISINIGTYSFALSGATLTFTSNSQMEFYVELGMDLLFGQLKLQMTTSCDGKHPVSLHFKAPSSTAPQTILAALLIQSPNSIKLPFGDSFPLSTKLDYVGFTIMQPCVGVTASLNLEDVHFRISEDKVKWRDVLPKELQPTQVAAFALSSPFK